MSEFKRPQKYLEQDIMPPSKTKIKPKDMNPEQFYEHNRKLGRIRNRRHYAKVKKSQGAGTRKRWRVVSYDENGKIQTLRIRKGEFIITFG